MYIFLSLFIYILIFIILKLIYYIILKLKKYYFGIKIWVLFKIRVLKI